MTAPIQYSIQLDTTRDGTFSTDITAYVVGSLNWNEGMSEPYQDVAPPARLTFSVSNRSGVFNREGYLSGELITNGGFDTWTIPNNPDGWTTVDDVVHSSFILQVNPSNGGSGGSGIGACNFSKSGSGVASIAQTIFSAGKTYLIIIPCTWINSQDSAGNLYITHEVGIQAVTNGDIPIGPIINAPGESRFYFHALSGQTSFKLTTASDLLGFNDNCDLTIDNVSIREVPLYAMVNKGMQCRLQQTYLGVTSTLFQGRINKIEPSAGLNNEPLMNFTIEDAMLELLDAEYIPPFLTALTGDVALTRMFDDAVIRWPYSGSFWLLETTGHSELDYSTYLYDHDVTTFETGITTFEYLGDVEDRGDGIAAQGYIRDLMAPEAGGRFWFDPRSAKFIYHNRQHDALNDTIAGVYAQSHFDSAVPKYGEDMVNDVTVVYTSRDVGSAGSVLWTLKSIPFLLKNGGKRTFNARYFDATNEQMHVGARTTVPPRAGVDYVANLAADGSSTVVSDKITMSVEVGGNSSKVTVSNTSGQDIYITYLQLRGTPITQIEERYQVVAGDSIAANELYPKVIDVRALDNASLAEQFGNYTVSRFKTPINRIETATFSSLNGDTMTDAAANRVVGDKVTISIESSKHEKNYIIVGMNHSLPLGGDHPRDVTWMLKPVDRDLYWMLDTVGKSELDQTTWLSF